MKLVDEEGREFLLSKMETITAEEGTILIIQVPPGNPAVHGMVHANVIRNCPGLYGKVIVLPDTFKISVAYITPPDDIMVVEGPPPPLGTEP
jgi:hypothetical protein